MRKRGQQRLLGSILLFVMLQVAWFCLLGIWIYWYVASYITFTEISERVYPQFEFNPQNVAALVGGLVLLVGVAGGITVLFGRLRRQVKVTRMYDSFIANVTHELKSPLASIQIHLETLLSRDLPPDASHEFLELILRDTARLERHINSILDITGLEERRSTLVRHEVNADALFRELFGRATERVSIPDDHIHIGGSAPCTVSVDERTMEIVLDNLVDNAVKYTAGEPDVTLHLACGKKRMMFSVTDRGIGISASDQRNVFRKFVRLENAESPSVKGTGLGLYWVREIIRHHGGRVGVSSPGPGEGTTFTVELPLARRARRADTASEPEETT